MPYKIYTPKNGIVKRKFRTKTSATRFKRKKSIKGTIRKIKR